MADQAPEIKVKITGEDTGVSAAIKELGVQLQQLKRTQDETGSSAQKMGAAEAGAGRSMREAREGARMLSEETGVHLSRSLTGVISRSATLGPLLEVAFPVAAAIGFGEVIASAAEKISTLIANTFIYTEAQKAEYAAQIQTNSAIEKQNEKLAQLKKAYELIGLSGSARGTVLAQQAKEDVDQAIAQLERLKAKKLEIADPGFFTRILGTALSTGLGIETGIEMPDVDTAIAAKARQVGEQQKKTEVAAAEQKAADKQLADEKATEAKAAAEKAKTLQDQIQKATLAQLEAGFANELALYKAQHSKLDQDNEADYQKGLESAAAYYARKKQLAAEASQKEIDSLTAERSRVLAAPTKDKAEEIANQTKAASLANQIAIAKVNAEKTAQQLTNEGAKKQEELDKKTLDYQSKIAQAQGLKFDEAKARIEAEAVEMAQTLREAGIAPDQVDAMVAKFKAAETQKSQFAGMKSAGSDATAALDEDEADIRLKNIAIVADVKIAELERARIPVLQQLATQLKAAAITPDQVKEADDFARSVDRLALSAKKASDDFTTFKDEASQAIKGDLSNFLGSTITQAKSVGDAFRQLGASVVSSVQRIVAELLVEIAVRKLLKALGLTEDDGAKSVATAAAKGTAQAAPLIAAAGTMTAAGGVITTSAVGLGVSAAALQLAADTLIVANSMSSAAGGMAGGGLVTGPGSGTSDSIPARLSSGEFVVRAAAVQAIGVPTLAMMNGLNVPPIRGMSIPRFAEGGLVTHGSGSNGVDVKMDLGLEEGLVLKHLSGKGAERIVLSHIGNNPKAVTRAISRGGS